VTTNTFLLIFGKHKFIPGFGSTCVCKDRTGSGFSFIAKAGSWPDPLNMNLDPKHGFGPYRSYVLSVNIDRLISELLLEFKQMCSNVCSCSGMACYAHGIPFYSTCPHSWALNSTISSFSFISAYLYSDLSCCAMPSSISYLERCPTFYQMFIHLAPEMKHFCSL
jgi:hypothetical protein